MCRLTMSKRSLTGSLLLSLLCCYPGTVVAAGGSAKECLKASEDAHGLAQQHRLHDERARLLECAAPSCPADIRKDCLRRVDEVNASIPSIVFEVRDDKGNDISAVKITMDDAPFLERLDGVAIGIDPGEHKFTFEIPGQPAIERRILVREAQKDRRETIVFGPPQPATPEPASAPMPVTAPHPPPSETHEAAPLLNTQRMIALVFGGIGVAGVGVGTVFGLLSKSKHDDADQHCDGERCRDQAGVDLKAEARSKGNLSTAFFIIGGAGLASGVTLWLTAPNQGERVGTQFGIVPGGVTVKGTW